MLHVYIGEESAAARAEVRQAIVRACAASPETRVERFEAETFDAERILEVATAENMFGGSMIVSLDGVGEIADGVAFLEERAALLAGSPHTIIVRETKPKAELARVLREHAQLVKEFLRKKAEKKEVSAVFTLADAFARGDKKSAWTTFVELRDAGEEAEPIHGMLFWSAKTLYLSRIAANEAEGAAFGVNGFSYRKYRTYAKDRDPEELLTMVGKLKEMYHDAHEGKIDLAIAIERFLLAPQK
ncbi:MAG TPA: hypothetical protein VLB83_00310 [Candidatus Paceibacterota bacterium]|nr:hypothetical protein [Candidatus Paceibacterota bacterium]